MKLVLDIGGTKTRVGLVSDTYKLLDTTVFNTSSDYRDGVKNIFDCVASKNVRISGICIGIAGISGDGKLYSSPNLKGWINMPLAGDFEKEFKSKVYLKNDAALAGLGEAVYGAGKEYRIVTYLTIGTGVGGARIVNKSIDESAYGFEPGHTRLFTKIKTKVTEASLETLISGRAIKKNYGKAPETVSDKKIWNDVLSYSAIGVGNTVFYWSPDIVVIGGGVGLSESFNIPHLEKELENILLSTYPKIPDIKKAALGDFSGMWGGISYLKDNLSD